MTMDREFGSNTSCVILSLMGLDDRLSKQLVQGHKRVLSEEYHQRVASTDWHIRLSSFKRYSFGMSKNCEISEASVAISRNKRCKMSKEEEERRDFLSDEGNVLGAKGFVDELISETYSSRNTTRKYFAVDNSSEPSTSFMGRYSHKRLLGNSFTDSRDGNYTADFLSNCNGCRLYSRSSAASSIIYRGRDGEKRNEALHQRSSIISNALRRGEVDGSVSKRSNLEDGPLEPKNEVDLFCQKCPVKIEWAVSGKDNIAYEPTAVLKVAVRGVNVKVEDGERLPRNFDTLCQPTSCTMLERNPCPSPAYHAIEQETSLKDSEHSFYSNESSPEMDSFKSFEDNYLHSPDSVLEQFDEEKPFNLSEHGTHLHSFGVNPSTAWPSEEGREDHCGVGYCEQESSKSTRIGENREFDYLVDILTEGGFCRRDLASSLDKWHSVESPLSPFIFEAVEKRYADDKSWETSERLLLFDRINSRLEGILRPSMLARISDRFRRLDDDVLWSSLVREGRELKGETIEDLLESDLGSLDVGEFVESIVTEIEWKVIDELAGELVGE